MKPHLRFSLLVAFHLFGGVLLSIAVAEPDFRPPPINALATGGVLGVLLGQASLLALWLSHGLPPKGIRIWTTICGVCYLAMLPVLIFRLPTVDIPFVLIVLWPLFVIVISIVSCILTICRYLWFTIGVPNTDADDVDAPITLRVIAILNVVFAVSFLALDVLADNNRRWGSDIQAVCLVGYVSITLGIIAAFTTWAALAKERMIVRLVFGAFFSASIGGIAIFAVGPELTVPLVIALFAAYGVQSATLVFIRPLGYRVLPPQPAALDGRDDLEELRAVSESGAIQLVHHYLYFPSPYTGKCVARRLRDQGYEVEDGICADGTNWLVLATVEVVPTVEVILNMRASLRAIAEANAGQYDGWEIEVPRSNP